MESILNNNFYKLIEHLIERELTPTNPANIPQLTGFMKEKGAVDMSHKLDGTGICKTYSAESGVTAISFMSKSHEITLENESFIEFQKLSTETLSIPYFHNVASRDFIETKSFEWMLEVKNTGMAQKSLTNHLKDKLDDAIKEYEFYFPVDNLSIEQPFKLNNIEFTYFTKEYMNDLFNFYQTAPTPMTREKFDNIFLEYHKVLIKVTANAEARKAKEIAKRKAELAIDVLKIIGLAPRFPESYKPFDLNYRLNYQTRSGFLIKEKSSLMDYSISMDLKNSDLHVFDNALLNNAASNGLKTMFDFISLNNSDELYKLIVNAIDMYSFALSISDLHSRIISLITIIESLLLEDDKEKGMEDKAITRFSKIMPSSQFTFDQKQEIKAQLTRTYKIRHKMVHKAIRRTIDHRELVKVQVYIIMLLCNLIEMNSKEEILDKTSLYERLNPIIV